MQPDPNNSDAFARVSARPLASIGLALMGGIVYAKHFPAPLSALLLIALLLIAAWVAALRRGGERDHRRINSTFMLLLAALLGAVRMEASLIQRSSLEDAVLELSNQRIQAIQGTVDELRKYESGFAAVYLRDVQLEQLGRASAFPGKLEVRASVEKLGALQMGERIQLGGEIIPVRGPAVPTGMNMQEYKYSLNVVGSVYLEEDTPIQLMERPRWTPLRGFAYAAVKEMEEALFPLFKDEVLREKIIGLNAAMCFGVRDMPSKLNADLALSGLAHITSISGLHVTLVLVLLFQALKYAGLRRKNAAIIATLAGVIYLIFVGSSIPTLRSVMMAFVFFGHFLVLRKVDALNTLGLAAVMLLMLYPAELFLPSFQLSFAAVLILILYRPIDQRLQKLRLWRPVYALLTGIFVSTLVTIGIAPLVAYYFHYLTWGAVLSNLAAGPISLFLLPITYLWMLSQLLPFAWLSQALAWAMGWLTAALIYLTEWVAGLSFFYFDTHSLEIGSLAMIFLAILFLFHAKQVFWKHPFVQLRGYHLALLLIGAAYWSHALMQEMKPLRIHSLALGQGDCTLIQTPEGHALLIDGGPPLRNESAQARPILVDYLLAQGVRKIDVLALSHPQDDHIGAMQTVVNKFAIGRFIEGATDVEIQSYRRLKEALVCERVPVQPVTTGDVLQIGSALTLYVLHPTDDFLRSKLDVNEKSLVLLMRYRELDMLFTGDIGFTSEERLVECYENLDVDLLKVPHHGSRYSTGAAFLSKVRPEIALIQVGRNHYGHPHSETRQRLLMAQSQVLRADHDGTAQISWWGKEMRIYTTKSNKLLIGEHLTDQR